MGIKKRTVSLWTVFVRYLFALLFCVVLLAAVFLVAFSALWQVGAFLPANAAETWIQQSKARIASAERITPDLIPEGCDYAVFGKGGEFLSGSVPESEAEDLWSAVQSGNGRIGGWGGTFLGAKYFQVIPAKQGYCAVLYTVATQFSDPVLRARLPRPEILFASLFLLSCAVLIFLLSCGFGKRLRGKLGSLRLAADCIRRQDLDFSASYGGIREIDEALDSLSALRNELKKSLESQWRAEQGRREEISALAHDIKTPLTIVRGNAEMLSETALTEEQRKYTDYVEKGAERMERYLEMLIGLSQAEEGASFRPGRVDSAAFFQRLCSQAEALASARRVKTETERGEGFPPEFTADAALLQRAVMNVVSNAVEYSPEAGTVFLRASPDGRDLVFTVTDRGPGFSPADLKNAAGRFYRGDAGRRLGLHYGMGLFIAESVAKKHGGSLKVSNSPAGGGMVELRIPGSAP